MDSFLFALVVVFLTSMGGRDQLLVARLSEALGQNRALLGVAMAVCAATAAVMAYAGASIAAMLPGPARQMLIAIALAVAGAELLWPVKLKHAAEPTRSLGAIALVLGARQIGDAARFAIFALAAATVLAPMAGLGGALGGAGALYLGWSLGDSLERGLPLRLIRLVLGGVAILLAAVIAVQARFSAL